MSNAQILDITPDEYHKLEAFSSTVAKELIARSPLHAKEKIGKVPTAEMDFGDVGHQLLLGKGKGYAVLPFDDWRTKAAKESSKNARKQGMTPILHRQFDRASRLEKEVRTQLSDVGIHLDGRSELVIVWDEETPHGVVRCKSMLDHVWLDRGVILDFKITEDAAPARVASTAANLGYAIQRHMYCRAMTQLVPELLGREKFVFAFCENSRPFAMNLVDLDGAFRELGERQWTRAIHTWAQCKATNEWPSYGHGINPISPPAWALFREEAASLGDPTPRH
jgi:hypothetical protein